ncbi:transcriptional regulator with XRE-family HTH domain [Catenulispora sp. GP43]|uniref:helix-turn-helix transcriptional regulator n=1 Tax=Catenulispora sp. GP43 TaxID=3156263 RepID=UPI003513F539
MAEGLRRWRDENNLTQEDFAAVVRTQELGIAVACSPQLVGRWERGRIGMPSHAYRRCLQRATGLSVEDMGFRVSWAFPDEEDGEQDQTPPIFGVQPWPTQPRPDPTVNEPPLFAFGPMCRPTTAADLIALQAMARAATATDRQFGGDCMRQMLDAYLTECVKPLIVDDHASAPAGALLAAAAELAIRVAWMNLDVGNVAACRSHMATAFTWAQDSGDSAALAVVLAMRTLEHIWLNNPRQAITSGAAAVRLSTETRDRRLHAFCLGKFARALSMAGKPDHAVEAMQASRTALAAVVDDDDGRFSCLDNYGSVYALDDDAHCFYGMCRHSSVLEFHDEILAHADAVIPARKSALAKATKIRSLIALDQIDQACSETKELAALAVQIASKRVSDRLGLVMAALKPHRKSDTVLDLEETVRGLVAGTVATRWLVHIAAAP